MESSNLLISIICYIFLLEAIHSCPPTTWTGSCAWGANSNTNKASKSTPTFTSPTNFKWTEEFDNADNVLNGWRWTSTRTSAFGCQNHNPGWNKLDHLQSNKWHLDVDNDLITFKAVKSVPKITLEDGHWAYNTGLLTTEYSVEKFMVKTDNYIETYVQLPDKLGAWPALFTWNPTSTGVTNEVDVFEYHTDHADTLEFTSHLGHEEACNFKRDWIKALAWVRIGTHFGQDAITWYVNGDRVPDCTKRGVGPNYSAYIILNLSVAAGDCATGPRAPLDDGNVLWFRSKYVTVYHNMSYVNK